MLFPICSRVLPSGRAARHAPSAYVQRYVGASPAVSSATRVFMA